MDGWVWGGCVGDCMGDDAWEGVGERVRAGMLAAAAHGG